MSLRRSAGFLLLLVAVLLVVGGAIAMSGRVFRDLDPAVPAGLGLAAAVFGLLVAVGGGKLIRERRSR